MKTLEVPIEVVLQIDIEDNGEWGWRRVVRTPGHEDYEPADLEEYVGAVVEEEVATWLRESANYRGMINEDVESFR